jgi:hypothetical protein
VVLLKADLQRVLSEVLLLDRILVRGLTVRKEDGLAHRTHLNVVHVHEDAPRADLIARRGEVQPVALLNDLDRRAVGATVLLQSDTVGGDVRGRRGQLALREGRQRRYDQRRSEQDLVARSVAEAGAEERSEAALRQVAANGRDVGRDVVHETTGVRDGRAARRVQIALTEEQRVLNLATVLNHLLLGLVLRLVATVEVRVDERVREAERITLDLAVVVVSNLLRHLDGAKRGTLSGSIADLDDVSASRNTRRGNRADTADNREGVRADRRDLDVLAVLETKNVASAEVRARTSSNVDRRVARQDGTVQRCEARHDLIREPLHLLRLSRARRDLRKHDRKRSLIRLQQCDHGGHVYDTAVGKDVSVVCDTRKNGNRH